MHHFIPSFYHNLFCFTFQRIFDVFRHFFLVNPPTFNLSFDLNVSIFCNFFFYIQTCLKNCKKNAMPRWNFSSSFTTASTDLCLRQCLSCVITPPPQVRVQAVHLAHSPHQYVVTSSSSSRLLEATTSS